MAKDRRSRDQKRKDKLAKKQQKLRETESLAYTGNKYKTDKLVPVWLTTETGIYEAFVVSGQRLTDGVVEAALTRLVKMIRAGTLPPLGRKETLDATVGQDEELVINLIRMRWEQDFKGDGKPSRDELVGVLRSILGSLEIMSGGPESQGYLRHMIGFLRKAGVTVEAIEHEPH